MQKILLLGALLLSSLPMLWAELSTGSKAPEFSLKDTSGKIHSLSDYEGRYVVLEWTNHRWIISFSKNQGEISIKDKEKNKQKILIENTKNSDLFKTIQDYFPDAELVAIKPFKKDEEND